MLGWAGLLFLGLIPHFPGLGGSSCEQYHGIDELRWLHRGARFELWVFAHKCSCHKAWMTHRRIQPRTPRSSAWTLLCCFAVVLSWLYCVVFQYQRLETRLVWWHDMCFQPPMTWLPGMESLQISSFSAPAACVTKRWGLSSCRLCSPGYFWCVFFGCTSGVNPWC